MFFMNLNSYSIGFSVTYQFNLDLEIYCLRQSIKFDTNFQKEINSNFYEKI